MTLTMSQLWSEKIIQVASEYMLMKMILHVHPLPSLFPAPYPSEPRMNEQRVIWAVPTSTFRDYLPLDAEDTIHEVHHHFHTESVARFYFEGMDLELSNIIFYAPNNGVVKILTTYSLCRVT